MVQKKIKLLKIPNNKFVSCSNPAPTKKKWEDINKVKNLSIKNLKNFLLDDYYDLYDDFVFFKINYNLRNNNKMSLPKTSRLDFMFGKPYEKKEDVFQIGSNFVKTGEVELFYKIPKTHFLNIKNKIELFIKELEEINTEEEYLISNLERDSYNQIFIINSAFVNKIEKIRINPKKTESVIMRILSFYNIERVKEIILESFKEFSGFFIDTGSYLSVLLSWEEFEYLNINMPWIFQKEEIFYEMGTLDSELIPISNGMKLPKYDPNVDYPVVGVIDSGCMFGEALEGFILENNNLINQGGLRDFTHGTIVCGLIVANDDMNKSCRDQLGNFCVKNYEIFSKVSKHDTVSSVDFGYLFSNIEKIVSKNANSIKVWNLSFGAIKNPWTQEVSMLGNKLDYLSKKYDVLFIVCSGNHAKEFKNGTSLNSPADSLNAISVGSVFLNEKSVESNEFSGYGRNLNSIKPEVCHFGGPNNEGGDTIISCDENGIKSAFQGTSYSAPRISRFASWLIKNLSFGIMETKSFILSNTSLIPRKKNNSLFGLTKTPNFDNFISGEIELWDNKNTIIEFDFTGIDKVEISYTFMVDPFKNLGAEYSTSDVKMSIISFINEKDWSKTIFRKKGKKETLTEKNVQNKYLNDNLKYQYFISESDSMDERNEDSLIKGGKYHNSRKKYINLTKGLT